MASGNTVEIRFAGDASGLNRVAKQVAEVSEESSQRMKKAFDGAGKSANDAEGKFMGMADLLDGLGGAFGVPTEGATNMMRSFGDLSGGFSSLQPMIGGAMTAFKSFGMSLLTNPIFLVIAGITALAAGLYFAYTRSETFREIVQNALGTVTAGFQWLWGVAQGVFSWVADNWQTIGMLITGPIGVAVKLISSHWEQIVAGVSWVGGVVSGVFSGVWDTVKSVFNRVADAWNATIGRLSIGIPDIPGVPGRGSRFDVPNIPVLHSGGTFRAPGGASEGLALLESGETILPRGGVVGAGAAAPTVVFNGPVGSRDVGDWIVTSLQAFFARGGEIGDGRGGRLTPTPR